MPGFCFVAIINILHRSTKMPQQLCKLCGQWLQGNPDWQKHALSPRHTKKVQQLKQRKQDDEASLFITGFRSIEETFNLEMLLSRLSEFGKIKSYFMGRYNSYGIFTFESKEVALKLLNAPPKIGGQTIIVRPRMKKQNRDGSLEDISPEPVKNIFSIESIPNVGSWECQAEHLAKLLGVQQAPQNPLENRQLWRLCSDIKMALIGNFPNCIISIFGSTITGLAGPDSDIDIFVDLSPDFEGMSKVRKTQRKENPKKFNEEIIQHCSQLLRKYTGNGTFLNVLPIPEARTPVIKCIHSATDTQVDINFKSCLCVINTNLLKYYFQLDPRVKQMITVLKYFIKRQNLTFSSYSLSFILLFFLMNLEKPLVPPVTAVLEPTTDNIIDLSEDMWKIHFKQLEFKSENQQSLKELLAEFFHFVRTFDYGIYVMCPLTGEAVPRLKFLEVEELPPAMRKLQLAMKHKQQSFPANNFAMSVQDPLELVHSITKAITEKHLKEFLELCKAAEDHCRSKRGLIELMSIKPEPPVSSGTSQNCVELMCYNYIPPMDRVKTGDDIRDIWFKHAKEVIEDIFAYVFHFENVNSDGLSSPPHKLPKVELTTWSQHKTLQTKFGLWNSRKKCRTESNNSSKITFSEEVDISKKLLQLFYVDTASLKPYIKIQIKLNQEQAPTRIYLEILDVSSEKNELSTFMKYLRGNLQGLLNKGLSENYKEQIDTTSAEDIVKQAVAQRHSQKPICQSSDTQILLLGTLDKLKVAKDIAQREDAKSVGPKVASTVHAQSVLLGMLDRVGAETLLKQTAPKCDVPRETKQDAQARLMSSLMNIANSSSSSTATSETSDTQMSQPQRKLTKEEKSPLRFLLKQAEEAKSTPEPTTSQSSLTSPAAFNLSNTRSNSPRPTKYGPKRKRNVQPQSGSPDVSADHPMEPADECDQTH